MARRLDVRHREGRIACRHGMSAQAESARGIAQATVCANLRDRELVENLTRRGATAPSSGSAQSVVTLFGARIAPSVSADRRPWGRSRVDDARRKRRFRLNAAALGVAGRVVSRCVTSVTRRTCRRQRPLRRAGWGRRVCRIGGPIRPSVALSVGQGAGARRRRRRATRQHLRRKSGEHANGQDDVHGDARGRLARKTPASSHLQVPPIRSMGKPHGSCPRSNGRRIRPRVSRKRACTLDTN